MIVIRLRRSFVLAFAFRQPLISRSLSLQQQIIMSNEGVDGSNNDNHSNNNGKLPPPPPPKEGIAFGTLPWNMNLPDEHYYMHLTTTPDKGWTLEHYNPTINDDGILTNSLYHYSSTPLPLYPSTTSLNYGTTIWEGLACRRSPTSQRALVFRPQMNYARFANGAKIMCLPPPSYELFMRGLQLVLQRNAQLIPPAPELDPITGVPQGGPKLYIRPMLLGSGQQLGLHVSPQISLVFFVSPTGSYFQGKTMGGLKLHLERRRSRAARGGTGNVKCCGNYAVAMRPLLYVDNTMLSVVVFGRVIIFLLMHTIYYTKLETSIALRFAIVMQRNLDFMTISFLNSRLIIIHHRRRCRHHRQHRDCTRP